MLEALTCSAWMNAGGSKLALVGLAMYLAYLAHFTTRKTSVLALCTAAA